MIPLLHVFRKYRYTVNAKMYSTSAVLNMKAMHQNQHIVPEEIHLNMLGWSVIISHQPKSNGCGGGPMRKCTIILLFCTIAHSYPANMDLNTILNPTSDFDAYQRIATTVDLGPVHASIQPLAMSETVQDVGQATLLSKSRLCPPHLHTVMPAWHSTAPGFIPTWKEQLLQLEHVRVQMIIEYMRTLMIALHSLPPVVKLHTTLLIPLATTGGRL